jgi:hypothetical protein
MVLPVVVSAEVVEVKLPHIPIVPVEENVLGPPLIFRLPKFQAGMVWLSGEVMVMLDWQFRLTAALVVEDSVPPMASEPVAVVLKVPVPETVKLVIDLTASMLRVLVPGTLMVT